MVLGKILDNYLGKPTNEVLHDLPSLVKELGYYFDCRCVIFDRYSNNYSHAVGYIIDEDKKIVTFYTGFLGSFCKYVKDFHGYNKYSELIFFSKTLEVDLAKWKKFNSKLKVKLYDGYLDYLKSV